MEINSPIFVCNAVVLLLLLLISVQDLRKGIIPNSLVLLLFFWITFWRLFFPVYPRELALAGFVAGGGFLYAVALLSRGGLGGGDIKLAAVLGLAAGWPLVLLVLLLAFVLGAAAGLFLLLSKRKTWRSSLPFAPFLALAFFLSSFWGQEIWHWYVSFF